MKSQKSSNWFLRGFILTFIVVLLAAFAVPTLMGRAQEGTNDNLPQGTEGEASTGRTDDPQGGEVVPFAGDENPVPNNLIQGEADATSAGRTDDPQGRTMIPFTDEASHPQNNSVFAPEMGGAFDPVLNQENLAREQQALGQYTSPLVIPGADFVSDGFDPDSSYFTFTGGYRRGTSANDGCLVAPAYLPDGVTVGEMYVSILDDDTIFNMGLNLRRVDNFDGTMNTMATVNSSGDFGGVQVLSDISIVDPVVAYPDYSYYVTTCLNSADIHIYSVRLYYTQP